MNLRATSIMITALMLVVTPAVWAGNAETIMFEITDARVDAETNTLIVGLKVSNATASTVLFTGYDPEYSIRINQNEYQFLGITRWRHPFTVRDILELSTANSYSRAFYYKPTDIPAASVKSVVKSVQFKMMRDASKNAGVTDALRLMNVQNAERYANLWSGVAETKVFEIEHEETSNQRLHTDPAQAPGR